MRRLCRNIVMGLSLRERKIFDILNTIFVNNMGGDYSLKLIMRVRSLISQHLTLMIVQLHGILKLLNTDETCVKMKVSCSLRAGSGLMITRHRLYEHALLLNYRFKGDVLSVESRKLYGGIFQIKLCNQKKNPLYVIHKYLLKSRKCVTLYYYYYCYCYCNLPALCKGI